MVIVELWLQILVFTKSKHNSELPYLEIQNFFGKVEQDYIFQHFGEKERGRLLAHAGARRTASYRVEGISECGYTRIHFPRRSKT